jgi:GTP pyrophosphokinase
MIQARTPMVFVKWREQQTNRYRVIVSLKDEKGALASLLSFLAKIDVNIISIRLGDGLSQSNLCELRVETREHSISRIRELIERRFKVLEVVSLNDAYNQH